MATLSVPLPAHLEHFIQHMVKQGFASNKAEVVRQALAHYAEQQLVEGVLRARQEFKEGKEVRGDVRKILQRMR